MSRMDKIREAKIAQDEVKQAQFGEQDKVGVRVPNIFGLTPDDCYAKEILQMYLDELPMSVLVKHRFGSFKDGVIPFKGATMHGMILKMFQAVDTGTIDTKVAHSA